MEKGVIERIENIDMEEKMVMMTDGYTMFQWTRVFKWVKKTRITKNKSHLQRKILLW